MENKATFRLWAKTTHDKNEYPNAFHPLICHLIDVATAAQELWNEVLPETIKKRLAQAFERENDLETVERLIVFLTGLHDLGKCSPPFALRGHNDFKGKQTKKLLELYQNTVFACECAISVSDAPHGFVTSLCLPQILADYHFPPKLAESVSNIIGGHHGIFPTSEKLKEIERKQEKSLGDAAWTAARKDLVDMLAHLLEIKSDWQNLPNQKLDNATAMIFAGFVTVADWIGSNTDFFKSYVEDSTAIAGDENFSFDLDDYFRKSKAQAHEALRKLGWLGWVKAADEKKFGELFPVIEEPRHLQNVAIEISPNLTAPGIVVVEAPMGEGKTEAAMFLADTWNAKLGQRGIYFALPTQATSNQMFGRIEKFLKERFPAESGEAVHLLLQHGHASIMDEFVEKIGNFKQIQNTYDDAEDERKREFSNIVAAEWFTYKKRGLLVPFGVGTIDQILLAVLQTKHVFVRLFGLANKTVIIDEVHAYDAYMSTLLERLLEWFAALKSPVVLLSATLPRNRRDALVKAYLKGLEQKFEEGENPQNIGDEDVYPRISYAIAGEPQKTFKVRKLNTSQQNTKRLQIEWKDEDNFVAELKEKLKDGGCAAIICNTVDRTQKLFDVLARDEFFQDITSDDSLKLDLLHARFRFTNRKDREDRCLERFAKPNENGESPHRPKLAVLIATQIVEQSLDLDFDIMISELAPADLLLQRAGRLQRHYRERLPEFKDKPTLWIIKPETDDKDIPNFGKSGVVYDKHILLRSWLKLKDENSIEIPKQIEDLIEAVYDNKQECFDDKYLHFWNETRIDLQKKLREKKAKAKEVYLTDFDDEEFYESFNFQLDENDPEKHHTLRAQTRDEERPSVSVILLTKDEADSIKLNKLPDRKTAEFLMFREVKISRNGLTQDILANPDFRNTAWEKSALLRHHRLIVLDENKQKTIGKTIVVLDDEKGVEYKTEGDKSE